jgi:rhodanese-related sulfurtransferase
MISTRSLKSSLWAALAFSAATGLAACGSTPSSESAPTEQSTPVQGAIAKDVNVAGFQDLMAREGALLLDVRSDGEWAEGHIEGAAYIPFASADFTDQLAALPKDRPVLIYCASGGRSAKAMQALNAAGHPEVYNLLGGIRAWQGAGNPLVYTEPVQIQ